jgi:hypothetical protein
VALACQAAKIWESFLHVGRSLRPSFSLPGFSATFLDSTIFLLRIDRRSAILPSAALHTPCLPRGERNSRAYVCGRGRCTINSAVQSTKSTNTWSESGVGPFGRHFLHILFQLQVCDVVDFSANNRPTATARPCRRLFQKLGISGVLGHWGTLRHLWILGTSGTLRNHLWSDLTRHLEQIRLLRYPVVSVIASVRVR